MARIYANGEWFEQQEPSTFGETEFEDRVMLCAPSIYPEYFVLPFKKTVYSEFGPARPDLIFISKNYRSWRIAEVEMGYHSLLSHIEPQIRILASANYGIADAEYLCAKDSNLELIKLIQLFSQQAPEVLLIVNQPVPNWKPSLVKYGVTIAIVELFRSQGGNEIIRLNGEYPFQITEELSDCQFHPQIPRVLELLQPNVVSSNLNEKIIIRFNNCITEWSRIEYEGKVWLNPIGRNPLNPKNKYLLSRQSDNSLILKEFFA